MALIGAILVLLGAIYAYARAIAKWNGLEDAFTKSINGLGERVRAVETGMAAIDSRADTLEREQARASDDRHRIHERIGRAEQRAEGCEDTMGQVQAEIAGRVNDMRMYGEREMSKIRERVKAVEVEIDLRNNKPPRHHGQ